MAASTLTIAFSQDMKSLSVTGLIAIRESVTVTITDGASLIDDTLVLKIQDKYNGGLTTPIAVCSDWDVSGDDAVGTLNTNTTEAIEAFVNKGNTAVEAFNVLVYTTGTSALMANGCIPIKNFPSSVTTDPVSLDQAATIAALTARIVALEATVSDDVVLYADFSAVTDLASNSRVSDNRTKINALLAILRDD